MKKLFFAVAALLCFVGCEYDDTSIWEELKKHDERITKLETLCNQMNTNISSLQAIVAALQNNDYVTAVTPITDNGTTIGYTISFSKSQPVTIYHGKDGKDGANGKDGIDGKDGQDGKDGANGKDGIDGKDGQDGKDGANGKDGVDGHTPQIGVKKDTDGIYYWTIDGEWLLDENGNKIKAVGIDGKDGQDGKDGADGKDGENGKDGVDGTNGKDGENGKDGVTPRLKIENEHWYVSYDNGTTWTELCKAIGEDVDSLFADVTQDDDNVYLTLVDGTVIAIAKHKPVANVRIYYATNDSKPLDIYPYGWGASIVDNVYDTATGKGYIEFDGNINTVPSEAFKNYTNLTEIDIHDGVMYIEELAFYGCTSLVKVVLPDFGKEIGRSAFYDCKNIKNVTIPRRMKWIRGYAFAGCTGLESITIPDNVTSIASGAFSG